MTRSIFDPTGGETERSGNRFSAPDAEQLSHMPTDVTDGVVEATDDETIVPANLGDPVASASPANNSMNTPESNPGVEAAGIDQSSPARGSDERPLPGSAIE